MKKRKLSMRTADRIHRAAWDYAELAERLKADGHERWANAVRDISSQLGKISRAMAAEIEGR